MILTLALITIFAYNDFDWDICAELNPRQANNNPDIIVGTPG